jgi:deoxyribodipyrimidine photolyase-like uncharacterized protein
VVRNLVIVFGDQLSHCSSAFTGFDPDQDAVWIAETSEENNSRMTFAMANLKHIRSDADELTAIHERAEVVFNKFQQRPTKDVADP